MPSFSPDTLRPGTVVEYIQNNQPVMGWVQEIRTGRVKLVNINQREMKLPLARILPWIGPGLPETSSRSEVLHTLKTLNVQRETLGRDIDPLELWELAQGEISKASLGWLAGLLWESPDADRSAALGRTLLEARTHFKFSPPHFEIYTQEMVKKRTEEMRRVQAREHLLDAGKPFFKELWEAGHKGTVPTSFPDPETAGKLESLLLDRIALRATNETDPLWKKMTAGLPDVPFLALLLAQAWGIVPEHYNYLLDQAGYTWEDQSWSAPFAADIDDLRTRVRSMAQEVECTRAVSIDSPSTRDIDDGFVVEKTPRGYRLELVLACPALGWAFGSPLDKAVMERFSSIYLPEGTANMLPQDLGTDFFSLLAGKDRPALILGIDVDGTGRILGATPRHGWVRLEHNLTYGWVRDNLASKTPDPMLRAAEELAQTLRSRRIEKGAVVMQQSDPRITLAHHQEGVEVFLDTGGEESPAHVLVSEFMILANTVIAEWATAQGVPLIFRTQNITLPKDSPGIWSDPCDIFRLIKCMGPSIMETDPKPHATLAVTGYAPITSPLRRYADFINSAQVLSRVSSQTPRWTKESIGAVLPYLSARAQAVGKIQRFRPRYWKYLFFKQQAKEGRWTGKIVEVTNKLVTVALSGEQLFLKAPRPLFGDTVAVGKRYSIRMGKIDPLNNELRIAEAREE
ncbi:ribonuclease catalytic domain-containing protein [Desulfoplanes sp.]